MCLISVLKKGTKKDTEEVYKFIRSGASCNTDGSGMMYKRNGENVITIDKGYFVVEDFIEKIKSLKLTEDDELVIHHRIGTSGRVSMENTHPFIITQDEELSLNVNVTTDKPCMVHNGVFWKIKEFERLNPDLSDTYAFSRYIMPDMMNILNNNQQLFDFLLSDIIGTDKLCILHPDRNLELIGKFTEDNGYYHSNSGYCRSVYNRGGYEDPTTAGITEGFNLPAVVKKKASKTIEDKNLIQVNKIDGSMIQINSTNYFHFFYISKSVYSNKSIGLPAYYWEIEKFNPGENTQELYRIFTDTHKALKIEETDIIQKDYYFIPRSKDFAKAYGDYLKLITTFPEYTKTSLKNVTKAINNAHKRDLFDLINYSKINNKVTKLSLTLYKTYLEQIKDNKVIPELTN